MDEALAVDASAPPEPDYPRHWEADVVASDGGVVHLRPILPGDADAIVAFHARLSERTRYLRYFGPYPYISPRDLERFTTVDHNARVALVALLGDEIIAVGRYEGTYGPDGTEIVGPAEVAFVVRDDHQSRGLGSILLEHLTAAGPRAGRAPLRGRGPGREQPDGAGVPGRRLPGQPRVRRRRAASRVRHRPHRALDGGPRRPRAARRGPQRAQPAAPALGRRHRRVDRPRQDRPRGARSTSCAATSPGRSIRSTRRPGRCAGCAPTRRSPTSRTTWTSPWSRCRRPVSGDVMGSCLAKGVKALVVLSAGFADAGPDGRERPAPARRRGPGARDAGGRAERAGCREHRPAGPAERHTRPDAAGGRPGRASSASPARSASRCWPPPPSAAWACRRSSPRATARTCPATTCCSTGRPTRPRMWCCCTWSRSATRASSPGWPAGSRARSRSSR